MPMFLNFSLPFSSSIMLYSCPCYITLLFSLFILVSYNLLLRIILLKIKISGKSFHQHSFAQGRHLKHKPVPTVSLTVTVPLDQYSAVKQHVT